MPWLWQAFSLTPDNSIWLLIIYKGVGRRYSKSGRWYSYTFMGDLSILSAHKATNIIDGLKITKSLN